MTEYQRLMPKKPIEEKMRSITRGVSLPVAYWDTLYRLADKKEVSVSSLVKQLIKPYMELNK